MSNLLALQLDKEVTDQFDKHPNDLNIVSLTMRVLKLGDVTLSKTSIGTGLQYETDKATYTTMIIDGQFKHGQSLSLEPIDPEFPVSPISAQDPESIAQKVLAVLTSPSE